MTFALNKSWSVWQVAEQGRLHRAAQVKRLLLQALAQVGHDRVADLLSGGADSAPGRTRPRRRAGKPKRRCDGKRKPRNLPPSSNNRPFSDVNSLAMSSGWQKSMAQACVADNPINFVPCER